METKFKPGDFIIFDNIIMLIIKISDGRTLYHYKEMYPNGEWSWPHSLRTVFFNDHAELCEIARLLYGN